jgi:Asp-tRNA(Asn)/Glu-tRNA(Gln) amidotransferase A subunit family amidase
MGLPIGMQLVAAMGEEGLLLGLASQLEPHFQLGQMAAALRG